MSSKRRIRRKSCEGKIRYTSLEDASRAAFGFSRRMKNGYHGYRCQFGQHYHIGHQLKSREWSVALKERV